MTHSYLPITSKENNKITNLVNSAKEYLKNANDVICTAVTFPEDISECSVEKLANETVAIYNRLIDAKELIKELSYWTDYLQGITEVED